MAPLDARLRLHPDGWLAANRSAIHLNSLMLRFALPDSLPSSLLSILVGNYLLATILIKIVVARQAAKVYSVGGMPTDINLLLIHSISDQVSQGHMLLVHDDCSPLPYHNSDQLLNIGGEHVSVTQLELIEDADMPLALLCKLDSESDLLLVPDGYVAFVQLYL